VIAGAVIHLLRNSPVGRRQGRDKNLWLESFSAVARLENPIVYEPVTKIIPQVAIVGLRFR
jgi:hypothetical protein